MSSTQEDLIGSFNKMRKNEGWKQNGGYAIRGNPLILERLNERIAVVRPITIDRKINREDQIRNFFDSLMRICDRNGIKDIFFQGGGTIPIPQEFLAYCKMNKITIHFITDENIDQYVRLELYSK